MKSQLQSRWFVPVAVGVPLLIIFTSVLLLHLAVAKRPVTGVAPVTSPAARPTASAALPTESVPLLINPAPIPTEPAPLPVGLPATPAMIPVSPAQQPDDYPNKKVKAHFISR